MQLDLRVWILTDGSLSWVRFKNYHGGQLAFYRVWKVGEGSDVQKLFVYRFQVVCGSLVTPAKSLIAILSNSIYYISSTWPKMRKSMYSNFSWKRELNHFHKDFPEHVTNTSICIFYKLLLLQLSSIFCLLPKDLRFRRLSCGKSTPSWPTNLN